MSTDPTEFLDHGAPEVAALVRRVDAESPRERAVRLYYAVRDGLRYEVFGADLSRAGLRASGILRAGRGMCIHKSIVYAAALRAVGVPSRLVFADVRNHLASPRLRELVGGDLFTWHCLTAVRLDGRWVRATPVFNRTLCRLFGIAPLEFDGTADSLHHPFDTRGRRHMEFVSEHGEFDDVPFDRMLHGLRAAHPRLFATDTTLAAGSLVADPTP